ncbi:MAG: DNA adenine methylase, partial [Desulfocapsaceae bacterium]|nr:DNA adenine methylase [Desulfocapsaceae bacterium]
MKGFIPYFGGKSRLAKTIINKIPEHTCYIEVFAGGAGVFFAKDPSPAEIINDLDKDLTTLYRAIKHHPEELYRQFKFSLVSRAEFERKKQVKAETLTDIQRAARYLYLQKSAFGGHITGQTFGTSTTGKPRLNLLSLEITLEEAWRRLAHAVIECKDFRDLIPRYDRPHSF